MTTTITFYQEYNSLQETEKKNLMSALDKRGVTVDQFRLLRDTLYPNVQSYKTLLLALDYCGARKLDIFKRTIQIVPIWNSDQKKLVDTIWPSIAEIRITAHRTNQFAGMDLPEFQHSKDGKLLSCTVTVYKIVRGQKCGFSAIVWYNEVVSKNKDGKINAMWTKRPMGQLAKCAEAAALRAAFPEEIGSDYIGEEAFDVTAQDVTPKTNAVLQQAISSVPDTPVLVEDKTPLDTMFNEVVVKQNVAIDIPNVALNNLIDGDNIDLIIGDKIYKYGNDDDEEGITLVGLMQQLQRMDEETESEFTNLNRESLIGITTLIQDKPHAIKQIMGLLDKHKEVL